VILIDPENKQSECPKVRKWPGFQVGLPYVLLKYLLFRKNELRDNVFQAIKHDKTATYGYTDLHNSLRNT
jgi:hypothetical protein